MSEKFLGQLFNRGVGYINSFDDDTVHGALFRILGAHGKEQLEPKIKEDDFLSASQSIRDFADNYYMISMRMPYSTAEEGLTEMREQLIQKGYDMSDDWVSNAHDIMKKTKYLPSFIVHNDAEQYKSKCLAEAINNLSSPDVTLDDLSK